MRIPKRIHRIWLGGSMPADIAEYGQKWKRVHPDWDVHTWRDWDMPALLNQDLYDAAVHPAERADIARLELVHRYGGLYVDADLDPMRPLDDLIADVDCFVTMEDEQWLTNVLMGAVPRHPFVAALIDGLREPVDPSRPINERTGPKYLTSRYKKWCERHPNETGVSVFPAALFLPYRFDEPERASEEFPHAFAVHRWQASWKEDDES